MDEKVKAVYGGIEIEYLEDNNRWRFELRGRERTVDTLRLAKYAIDKPAPKDKSEKPFTPIEAYIYRQYDAVKFQRVTVTSVAETTRTSGEREVWISNNGKRSKEQASSLFLITATNDASIVSIYRLQNQIKALEAQILSLTRGLTRLKVD
jgi:hypothetical protein